MRGLSRLRRCRFQNVPLVIRERRFHSGVINLFHLILVGAEAAIKIVNESGEIVRPDAFGDLTYQIARQLADLDVLQTDLALRVAAGNLCACQRRQQRLFLRLGPPSEMLIEIDQRDFDRRAIVVLQRMAKVIEATAQSALCGEERFEPTQIPASPGSIRVKSSSMAQRSMDSERRSSISGIGRASWVRSMDFT